MGGSAMEALQMWVGKHDDDFNGKIWVERIWALEL